MDQFSLEQARDTARRLARRVQEDTEFAQQILQDPIAKLGEAGLPEEFVPEFLEQTHLSEVHGYLSPSCGLTVIL